MTEEIAAMGTMHLTKSRLEALSDGIFAFAMTLLVIGLNLPVKSAIVQSQAYALNLLFSLYSDFFHYVLAFLILGAFWLSHHIQLHPIKSLDKTYVWLNLVTLLFVALLPFSTSFSGDFPNVPLGAIVFELNLLAIGMGMYFQWIYATGKNRLAEPNLNPRFLEPTICREGRMGYSHGTARLLRRDPDCAYGVNREYHCLHDPACSRVYRREVDSLPGIDRNMADLPRAKGIRGLPDPEEITCGD
jgi:uncharacterized membrane protein